jgi:hypothetical protein
MVQPLPSDAGEESRRNTCFVAVVSQPPPSTFFPAGQATDTVWFTF